MWDRDLKITRDDIGRKIKSTVYINIPGSKYCEAETLLLIMTQGLENT